MNTVNLAPADVKKEGAGFDLPMAVGILTALEVVSPQLLEDYLLLGELSLDGRVKSIRGALSLAMAAKSTGKRGVLLPKENAEEAAVVQGIDVLGSMDRIGIHIEVPAVRYRDLTGDASAEDSKALLEQAIDKLGLSARAYTRILKIARTIADLERVEEIAAQHVSEAIQYRSLDRTLL